MGRSSCGDLADFSAATTQPKTRKFLSVGILQHGLRRSVTSCQPFLQVDCQNLLSKGLLQIVSTSGNKSGNNKVARL